MDTFAPTFPWWVIAGLAVCVVVVVLLLATAFFGLLFKVGVAINESRKPPHMDAGDYRLDQGREVRPEAARRAGTDGPSPPN